MNFLKKYSEWDKFNSYEYQRKNYGRQIFKEDKQIIKDAIGGIKSFGFKPQSFKKIIEIGVGPNLYPSMLIAPYMTRNGVIELKDWAKPNLEYLEKIFSSKEDKDWIKFEGLMVQEGGVDYKESLKKVFSLAAISQGNIYHLTRNSYDAAISFFVAESITNSKDDFHRAMNSLISSVKPGGLLLVSHMVKSDGYHAGKRTNFPAVSLSVEEIKEAYRMSADIKIFITNHKNDEAVRKGYTGMALVVGKKL